VAAYLARFAGSSRDHADSDLRCFLHCCGERGLHRGPMDNVMATIQTLARWIDENGYRSSGHVRELTLECPDDPDKWVTELQEPITPA
jgi:hypothetical protein